MKNSCRFSRLLVLGLALAVTPATRAYVLTRLSTSDGSIFKKPVTWDPGSITMLVKMGTDTVFEDGTNPSTTVLAAMAEWNAALGAVQFVGQIQPPGPAAEDGADNEIVFSSTVFGSSFGANTIAVAVSQNFNGVHADGTWRLTHADILFNSNPAGTWGSYRGTLRANVDELRRVAAHELGHVLGLGHPNLPGQPAAAVMNSHESDVDTLQQDDIDGGQSLYGPAGPIVRPGNDNFADAAIIPPGLSAHASGRSTSATLEPGEPAHLSGATGARSLWWRFTPPISGSLKLVTAGSNFDTVLAVYTGNTLAGLAQIASSDDVASDVLRTSALAIDVTAGTTYSIAVDGWEGESGSVELDLALTAGARALEVIAHPEGRVVALDGTATFAVTVAGTAPSVGWERNGVSLPNATGRVVTLTNVRSVDTGLLVATLAAENAANVSSRPAILGLLTTTLLTGAGTQVLFDTVHPNGNVFDQVLLNGAAATIRPDDSQVVRMSFVDLNDDIVQVEMSGAGSLSLVLDLASGPASPVNYNQPTVSYMKGNAGIVIVGANATTNLTIATVGRLTAFDPTGAWDLSKPVSATNNPANNANPIFRAGVDYDGIADVAFVAIQSKNGWFGGLRTANASYSGTRGYVGVYAPDVKFTGPVFVGDIVAFDTASPGLMIGIADVTADVRITGGDLNQANGRPVQVEGIKRLRFADGSTSHGGMLPAQANKGRLEQHGVDVTAQLVVGP